MHEFSIALNIIKIAEEQVIKKKENAISSIEIETGPFSGVIVDALEFAFQQARKNTLAENATLSINWIEGKLKCLRCNHVFKTDTLYTLCPVCNAFETEIVQGQELKIRSIEIH